MGPVSTYSIIYCGPWDYTNNAMNNRMTDGGGEMQQQQQQPDIILYTMRVGQ